MTSEVKERIDQIVERIVEAAQPEQIILFGSHARGGAHPDSDVDLLVIESEPFRGTRSRLQEIGRLARVIGTIPIATGLLVYSRDEADRFRHSLNHIVRRTFSEGEVVYARS